LSFTQTSPRNSLRRPRSMAATAAHAIVRSSRRSSVTQPPESSREQPVRDSQEDQLAAGREALQRHAWREAFEQLRGADAAKPLPPEDLELLAEAAQWV